MLGNVLSAFTQAFTKQLVTGHSLSFFRNSDKLIEKGLYVRNPPSLSPVSLACFDSSMLVISTAKTDGLQELHKPYA